MIELTEKCPECGAVVKFGHTERHAMCADCGHVWEPVLAPPVQSGTEPRISIEAGMQSLHDDNGTVPTWLRGPENRPVLQKESYIESQLMPGERLIALTRVHVAIVNIPLILTLGAGIFFLIALVMALGIRGESGILLGFF